MARLWINGDMIGTGLQIYLYNKHNFFHRMIYGRTPNHRRRKAAHHAGIYFDRINNRFEVAEIKISLWHRIVPRFLRRYRIRHTNARAWFKKYWRSISCIAMPKIIIMANNSGISNGAVRNINLFVTHHVRQVQKYRYRSIREFLKSFKTHASLLHDDHNYFSSEYWNSVMEKNKVVLVPDRECFQTTPQDCLDQVNLTQADWTSRVMMVESIYNIFKGNKKT